MVESEPEALLRVTRSGNLEWARHPTLEPLHVCSYRIDALHLRCGGYRWARWRSAPWPAPRPQGSASWLPKGS